MDNLNTNVLIDFYNTQYTVLYAKERDRNSRTITFMPTNQSNLLSLENVTARILYTKPDGHIVFNDAEIKDDGTIVVTLTEQMLIASGKAIGELYLVDSVQQKVLSSSKFSLMIDSCAVDHSLIESTDEFWSLNELLIEIPIAIEKCEDATSDCKDATENCFSTTEVCERLISQVEADESARQSAENERVDNESARIYQEELRDSNESSRIANEAQRILECGEAIQKTDEARVKAEEAADNANIAAEKCEGMYEQFPAITENLDNVNKNITKINNTIYRTNEDDGDFDTIIRANNGYAYLNNTDSENRLVTQDDIDRMIEVSDKEPIHQAIGGFWLQAY